MSPRQIALLKFAKNGIRPTQPREKQQLDGLVQGGFLTREESGPLTPGGPTPIPIYWITTHGLAALEYAEEN